MKNLILFLTCAIIFGYDSSGQIPTKHNPFEMVHVPDSVRNELAQFLKREEMLNTPSKAIYIYNLLEPDDFAFKNGIYEFRLMGPHFVPRIFILNNGEIKIFKSFTLEDLLNEYLKYLKGASLTTGQEIRYLNAIAKFLQGEYYRETS